MILRPFLKYTFVFWALANAHLLKAEQQADEIKTSTSENSSAHARMGKNYYLGAEIGSIPFSTQGVVVGYYLKPDFILEGAYDRFAYNSTTVDVEITNIQARSKKFWGNSFYTSHGLGYRTAKLDVKVLGESASATISSLGLDLGIGNRWQWDRFSIGIDWYDLFIPFIFTGDTSAKGSLGEAMKTEMDKNLDSIGKAKHGYIFRLSLGFSL